MNIGCGAHYHKDWINVDMAAHGPSVVACDIRKGIPLEDRSCDAVYHSCILEHLSPDEGFALLRECNQVLKPRGIGRVAVPDLKRICVLYLEKLSGAVDVIVQAENDYDWMMLEMYDQTDREKSGGRMVEYLRQKPIPNQDFVLARIGEEARAIMRSLTESETLSREPDKERTLARRLQRRLSLQRESSKIALGALKKICVGAVVRALEALTGEDVARYLRESRFKSGGEIRKWIMTASPLPAR